jgi:hypothetical protein
MILITERPSRTNAQKPSLISKWSAIEHPIIFRMQRVDFVANTTADDGFGKLKLLIISATVPDLSVGDLIKVISQPGFSLYDLTAEILSITPTGGGAYDIVVDSSYLGANPAFIIASRPDYRLEIEIFEFDWSKNVFKSIQKTNWKPNPSGVLVANLAKWIGKKLNNKNQSAYNAVNWRDNNASGRFYFLYRELYTGSAETQYGSAADVFYFTQSAKKLGDLYGQNLGEFVPYADADAAITNRAKFITDFEEPTYWPGYPWDLGFLYTETIQGFDITLEEDRLSASGSVIGHVDANIDQTQALGENRLRVIFPSDLPGYSANVKKLKIWLELGGVATSEYVEEGYVDPDYVESVPEIAPGPITPYKITEEKTIRVNQECQTNPIYLSWKGTNGRNYWLFDGTKAYNTNSKQEGEFQVEPEELQTAQEVERVTKRTSGEAIKMGAVVDGNDYRGLRTLAGSAHVQLWTANMNNQGWTTVKLKAATFEYDTKEDRAEVKIEILLPENFNLPN